MEKLTKSQLQAICNQKGISYTSKDTKEKLIEMINNSKTRTQVSNTGFKGEY